MYIEIMPSAKRNPSIHVLYREDSPKISFFDGPYMIACFHEHLALEWKNYADSKYDSQFTLRAFPDYEPLNKPLNTAANKSKTLIYVVKNLFARSR